MTVSAVREQTIHQDTKHSKDGRFPNDEEYVDGSYRHWQGSKSNGSKPNNSKSNVMPMSLSIKAMRTATGIGSALVSAVSSRSGFNLSPRVLATTPRVVAGKNIVAGKLWKLLLY